MQRFLLSIFASLLMPVAWAQTLPSADPRAPRMEFGGGYESSLLDGNDNLLISVSLRPQVGTWGGNPEQHFFRTRIEITGAVDVDGPGIVSPRPGEVPYFRMRLVPVEMAETGAWAPTNVYETSLGFVPVNVGRDLRMGRNSMLRVDIAAARMVVRQMTSEFWGLLAEMMVEAIGIKLIDALPGSPERSMSGVDIATLTTHLGVLLRTGPVATITLAIGGSINIAVGDIAGSGWGYQQDTNVYLQLQADFARYVSLFARIGTTQAIYGSTLGFEVNPGVLQFMAGATVNF